MPFVYRPLQAFALALACWMRKRAFNDEAHSELGVLVASRFYRLRIRSSPTF